MTVKRCEGRRLSLLAVTALRPPQSPPGLALPASRAN